MKRTFLILISAALSIVAIFLINCKKEGAKPEPEKPQVTAPIVVTASPSLISVNSVTTGGSISSDGGSTITSRGVCWGTKENPTVSDNKLDGSLASASFTVNLTGLGQGTTYYFRAYAINGVGTAYGSQQSFTTDFEQTQTSYFPVGVWMQDPKKNASGYKNIGINTFVGLWNPLDQDQYNALKNAGLKFICTQNEYGLTLGNDPLLIGWMHGDEPDNAQWNAATQKYDPCILPSTIINNYTTLNQNDPNHPVYLNLGQGVAYNNYVGRGACRNNLDTYKVSTNGYLVGCDMASFDIYPVNNTDGITNGKLEYVALGIQNLISWSGNKPAWCWIESTKISDSSPRKPTTSEVRSEVWMGLIHGASGFGYFCHSMVTVGGDEAAMLHDTEMAGAIKLINAQINYLSSPLKSATTAGYATVNTSNSIKVDMMTKNYGGANYIFAIAMSNSQTTATFSVTSGSKVEVISEGRSINIANGKFDDTFSGYAVHLYKITN